MEASESFLFVFSGGVRSAQAEVSAEALEDKCMLTNNSQSWQFVNRQ